MTDFQDDNPNGVGGAPGEYVPNGNWDVNGPDPMARCSGYSVEGTKSGLFRGMQLEMPGAGTQEILVRSAQNTLAPIMSLGGVTLSFPLVTNQGWAISCLPNAVKNGKPGEAFLAVSPAGTKYWFDWMTFDYAGSWIPPVGGLIFASNLLDASLLVTKIEDRFGNQVTYSYGADRLVRITASDGRDVKLYWTENMRRSVDYMPRLYINKIVVQPGTTAERSWTYGYEVGIYTSLDGYDRKPWKLRSITLPDGSSWRFDIDSLTTMCSKLYIHCPSIFDIYEFEGQPLASASIRAPSGLTGTYNLVRAAVGRNGTGLLALVGDVGKYATAKLASKRYSGAGVNSTWTYSYVTQYPYNVPVLLAQMRVVNPDGTLDVSVVDNFTGSVGATNPTEGRLVRQDSYAAGQITLLRSQSYEYADYVGPYPQKFGSSISFTAAASKESLWPLRKTTTTQDGVTFSNTVNTYDVFARPVSVTRSGPLAPTRTETTEYFDGLNKWVLGQVKRTTVNGIETTRTEFDPATALPWKTYNFGESVPSQTLGYHADGTVRTVTDALNHTTTLSSWKRGIPQTLQHPDATTESAVVNDAGWITSVTDEAGATTRYDYDPMGRLSLIDYPDADNVDWTSTVLNFAQISADEYGIASGHWRQTATAGNHRKSTYFDALWQPLVEREEDLSNAATVRVSAKRYDHEGRVTDAYYPQTNTFTSHAQFAKGVHTKYDALGRVTQTTQDAEGGSVLTATAQYLPGFETLVTDPRNKQTRTRYAALDQPTTDYPVKQFLPEGVEVTIARDVFFKPTQLTRSGPDVTAQDRFYMYDAQQRLCRLFEPETDVVMAYDAAGNVAWSAQGQSIWGDTCGYDQVAASQRITRHYDLRNRLVFTDYPAGTDDVTLGYEPTGEVRLARLGNHAEWRYTHNKRGLLTREALSFDGDTQALDYAYTPLAALSRVTYPGGRAVDYAPNALGQPTQAGSYATGVAYSPDGDASSFRYGNGIAYASSKNERRLPNNLTYAASSGSLLYSQDLSYDPNANLSQVTDLAGSSPSRSKTLGYDGLNRLTSATAPGLWGTETYQYDSLDNIRQRTKDGLSYVYSYDVLNRLSDLKVGGNVLASYWYDMRGNTTCKNKDGCINNDTLTFDLANRLQAYNGRQNYQYDAWGRRLRKTSLTSGAETLSLYSQGGQLMREHDSAANTRSDYVYLGQKMVAKVSDVLPKLTAPSLSGGGHTLSWEASPTAVRYIVQESVDFGAWTQVYSGTDLNWSAGGRTPGTYRYRVLACTADGVCSTLTSPMTVKVGVNIVPMLYELLLN